jgi:hypothetical protein
MGDMGDGWNELKHIRGVLRRQFGIECQDCIEKLPKSSPSILLPGQRCKIKGHGFKNTNPRITQEQRDEAQEQAWRESDG